MNCELHELRKGREQLGSVKTIGVKVETIGVKVKNNWGREQLGSRSKQLGSRTIGVKVITIGVKVKNNWGPEQLGSINN